MNFVECLTPRSLPGTGGVLPWYTVRAFQLQRYENGRDWVINIAEYSMILILLCIVFRGTDICLKGKKSRVCYQVLNLLNARTRIKIVFIPLLFRALLFAPQCNPFYCRVLHYVQAQVGLLERDVALPRLGQLRALHHWSVSRFFCVRLGGVTVTRKEKNRN